MAFCPGDGFPTFSVSRCEDHLDTCLKSDLVVWALLSRIPGRRQHIPNITWGLGFCGHPAYRGIRLVTCSPLERAIGRLRRSEYPFGVVLGWHFTPEFLWSDDTYAGTRYPETLSRLGLRLSRFRRFSMTTASGDASLRTCLHSSFTMTTCSTCRRVRLTAYRLSTLALRHLITSHLP